MTGDTPQEGFYKTRLTRGGPWVPAKVWFNIAERDEAGDLLEDEGLMCKANGELVNVDENWIWLMGNEIDEAEYNFMTADSEHAKTYRPDDPKANPTKAIDLGSQKSIF